MEGSSKAKLPLIDLPSTPVTLPPVMVLAAKDWPTLIGEALGTALKTGSAFSMDQLTLSAVAS